MHVTGPRAHHAGRCCHPERITRQTGKAAQIGSEHTIQPSRGGSESFPLPSCTLHDMGSRARAEVMGSSRVGVTMKPPTCAAVGRQALVVARPEAATALAMQLCSPAHGATGPGSDFVATASDFAHIYADRHVLLWSACSRSR